MILQNIKKRLVQFIICCVVIVAVVTGLIIGNTVCFANFNLVTQYMCGMGLSDDTEEAKAARAEGMKLAQKVTEEGAVLLKNENNALPLRKGADDKIKVNVFGLAGTDKGYVIQGTGSGTGSRNDVVTLLGGLTEAGIDYNTTLIDAYRSLDYNGRVEGGSFVIEAGTDEQYQKYYGVAEAPNSFYSDELISQAKDYSDTAIVVIGRILGEGNDYSHYQYLRDEETDTSRKLQSLSQREEFMLEKVKAAFGNVIVIFNTTNPVEAGFADDDRIDAAIYMGTPGSRGTIGLANLLTGAANPSGRLTDTWAYDLASAASYVNAGREGNGSYTNISGGNTAPRESTNKYTDYAEDIYIGYKWYETADAEGYWDDVNNQYGKGYEGVVQYPFGYGLSYTDFTWSVTGTSLSDGATLSKDGKISFDLSVKNTGSRAGMDVVELYYTAPYTKGGIEKSDVVLGAFYKTGMLEPGEDERLTITMSVEDMKSYDCYDKNNNGFMGYELEAGDYVLSFRTDAHTLADMAVGSSTYTYRVPDGGFRYETDSVTGTKVENQFTNYTNPVSGASSTINEKAVELGDQYKAHSIDGNDEEIKVQYMTRADFKGTFPQKLDNRAMGDSLYNETYWCIVDPYVDPNDVAPEFNSNATAWQLVDLYGLPYEDEMWDELVSQLSLETCAKLIHTGGFGTIDIDSIGKPKTVDTDGPTGFNNNVTGNNGLKAVNYPSSTILASTWDWFMAYSVGLAIGLEGKALGIQGWYGPGANMHRSPMGGRNFEYYSEDARLSGIICAYHVLGAKENGVTAYIKHIAVNDGENGRGAAYKWLTEQNLRENYLLPFELAVKIGKSNAMMGSVDRVGSVRATESYAMLTAVLRDEWGFRGTVITDYYQSGNGPTGGGHRVNDVDAGIRAGLSQLLWPDGRIEMFNDISSNTAKKFIHQAAKDILFAYTDTIFYSETAQGLEKGSLIGTSVEVFPWWVILLVGIDVAAIGLLTFWMLMILLRKPKESHEPQPQEE